MINSLFEGGGAYLWAIVIVYLSFSVLLKNMSHSLKRKYLISELLSLYFHQEINVSYIMTILPEKISVSETSLL